MPIGRGGIGGMGGAGGGGSPQGFSQFLRLMGLGDDDANRLPEQLGRKDVGFQNLRGVRGPTPLLAGRPGDVPVGAGDVSEAGLSGGRPSLLDSITGSGPSETAGQAPGSLAPAGQSVVQRMLQQQAEREAAGARDRATRERAPRETNIDVGAGGLGRGGRTSGMGVT